MLLVPSYVAKSNIHGVGVFAATFIPKDTRVWEFTEGVDMVIPRQGLDAFPEPFRTWLRMYCYAHEEGLYILCGDNAKFMNHSPEANCDDSTRVYTTTRRDIAPGEELTCDYALFDLDYTYHSLQG